MVFKYCFGMIMSVSTFMIFRGAATPSSVVNFSIDRTSRLKRGQAADLSRISPRQKANLRNPSLRDLAGTRLNRLHVGVRQPKVVPDLVDQDVADDMAERFLMLGPVVEDRTAVEPDH